MGLNPQRSVAVIPARSGSKRIHQKNTRDFCGKPMISYAIQNCLKSELFDRVLVSTDSEETAEIAARYGAEVPFLRPTSLADDFTTTVEVMRHALRSISADLENTAACCVYPATPFLTTELLSKGLQRLRDSSCDFVCCGSRFSGSFYRALEADQTGRISLKFPQYRDTRTQDLPTAYHDAGQFYWARGSVWLARESVLNSSLELIEVDSREIFDIDEPEDWDLAELIAERRWTNQELINEQ
jgi:pseudaminic acid cytidylyltransferase